MTELIIVRHGYSEGNRANIFQGQLDVLLTPEGHLQAKKTAQYLATHYRIDRIYASDLTRTCQTAQPLADLLGLPIQTCKDLREINVGKWQGVPRDVIRREHAEKYANFCTDSGSFRFDGGESYADLMERGARAMERIAQENDGKTVVVATHGGVIRTLLLAWKGLDVEHLREIPLVPNCSLTFATYENGCFHLHQALSDAHLTDFASDANVGITV